MVAVTTAVMAAASVCETLNELDKLINSQEPLLIQLNNRMATTHLIFNTVTNMHCIEAHAMPTPYIAPGEKAQAHFGASNWSDACLTMQFLTLIKNKDIYLEFTYNWQTKFNGVFTIEIKDKTTGINEDPRLLCSERGTTFTTKSVATEYFNVYIHASGKLVDIDIIDR